MRAEVPDAALRDFVRQDGGIHLLLLHASDMTQVPEGVTPYKPILPSQVEEAGFSRAVHGRDHDARTSWLVNNLESRRHLGGNEMGKHLKRITNMDEVG